MPIKRGVMDKANTRWKRREIIKCLGAGVAVGALSRVSAAAETIQWKMVTTWPKNFPALGTGANRLAELIDHLSNGRLKVKVYGAQELVPAMGVFDAVSRGTAEMGHGASYYWKGKHEATQFFSAVPFGLSALEMNGWLTYGGGQKLWDELYSDFGLKPFAGGNTGVQMGGWFKKEINSSADFNGLKVRMPGLGGEVLRRMGSTVVTLSGGEIFQALFSGAIDASEWVGPYNDLAFGLHKAAPFYYWPGWHEPGTTLEVLVNKSSYEKLPKDLQTIVAVACQAVNDDMLSEFSARNAVALASLVGEHKVQLRKFSDEILKKLGTLSRDVVAEAGAKDALSKKVFASFDGFRKNSIGWGKISEEGYSLARALTFK